MTALIVKLLPGSYIRTLTESIGCPVNATATPANDPHTKSYTNALYTSPIK